MDKMPHNYRSDTSEHITKIDIKISYPDAENPERKRGANCLAASSAKCPSIFGGEQHDSHNAIQSLSHSFVGSRRSSSLSPTQILLVETS